MNLNEIVSNAFLSAFPECDVSAIRVVPATDVKFGDYQCNDALKMAKACRMNPRMIATKVAEVLSGNSVFEKVEVAGPGFS